MKKGTPEFERFVRHDAAVNDLHRLIQDTMDKAEKIKPHLPQLFKGTADFAHHAQIDFSGYLEMWVEETGMDDYEGEE